MNATLLSSPERAIDVPIRATGTVQLIGVPMDLGASRRGVDMGPSAMRHTSLVSLLHRLRIAVDDAGNISVPDRSEIAGTMTARLEAIRQICAQLAERTAGAIRAGMRPLVLGGDHSLAAGSVAGTA
ncbi:MAG TPA: arginase family protein, partial [Gemmatimonadaceae bacterium]|nr:arginase family protein [Gemmatimonadaceae bacterium]